MVGGVERLLLRLAVSKWGKYEGNKKSAAVVVVVVIIIDVVTPKQFYFKKIVFILFFEVTYFAFVFVVVHKVPLHAVGKQSEHPIRNGLSLLFYFPLQTRSTQLRCPHGY